jgi:flagellar biosynthetic protein FlhB
MAESAQDRKLPASQRKIDKSREKGQVARSRDLGHFGAIGAGVGLLTWFAPELTEGASRLLVESLRFDAATVMRPAALVERLSGAGLQMLLTLLLPLLGRGAAVAAGRQRAQRRLELHHAAGAAGLHPRRAVVRAGPGVFDGPAGQHAQGLLHGRGAGHRGAVYLQQNWPRHVELLAMPLPAALATGGDLILGGLLLLAAVMAAFALVDVPLQRQMLLRRLRMSVEEMKKEFKEMEGSAEVKGRQRQRMRELSSRRMLAAVPLADLVVMNPTHYAVALRYDEAKMAAPRVVAKGADLLALKIRDLARDAKVPVLQAPPLARALYAHTEVDQEVPARLFSAVAQVLAWVYQVRDALAKGRPRPPCRPCPMCRPTWTPSNRPAGSAE